MAEAIELLPAGLAEPASGRAGQTAGAAAARTLPTSIRRSGAPRWPNSASPGSAPTSFPGITSRG